MRHTPDGVLVVHLSDGYFGRPLTSDDLPAVEKLLEACDANEREASYRSLLGQVRAVILEHAPDGAGETIGVFDGDGGLVACASFNMPDYPRPVAFARVQGAVHPRHRCRGIGHALLTWTERRANVLFDRRSETRPRSLRVTFSGRRYDAEQLYARCGFTFHERTLQLRRPLDASVIERPLPSGIVTATWSDNTGPLFYAANAASGSYVERPEARTQSEQEWCADVAADATLRPDLSLVALDRAAGDRPCAFILAEVVPREGRAVGWIWLLAVAPSHRRRGLATFLLSHALAAFGREGLPEVGLWVNEANDPARALYERLGFCRRSQETTYAKALNAG